MTLNPSIFFQSRTHLSENEVSDLTVDESALGEVDETILVEVRVSIVHEGQIRHVQTTGNNKQINNNNQPLEINK